MKDKETFMSRAIQLAKNGLGMTSPNPMVGCVIERNGFIISEGWHYKKGMDHAEAIAINRIKNKSLFLDSTLYVTLEPCVHFGETSPCVDLIIKNHIPRIVVGIQDPHDKVKGLGIQKLKEYGIEVIENVLKNKCRFLNKRFFTFHEKNRPYIILKWAQSHDGFIGSENKKNIWISGTYARQLNHKWRAEEDSILVGRKTVLNDNPKLNVREWFGSNPIRIFIDKKLKISDSHFILDGTQKTIVFTEKKKENQKNIEYIQISFEGKIINHILNFLYKKNILSLIVEGGKKTLESFIKENVWDECRIFVCDVTLKKGLKAPRIGGEVFKKMNIGSDLLFIKKIFY
ncbi:bifunctional diaminohydroxyphosphoribosylaminopyrimidine deaminase/5-amino-6-(5-phosphoribosylamino)uracil reductase [Blattabacterium sp. (Blattella germanica) str. Bge]|uniref:bifunctional diaminohydroxyphosphoribosylaminopyrimidine deaminase/5-amino-6-(5-phosphoribosylamino)uracil reductase RibD n=1 Tax=Blattabacterium sp. (Blattella germanica) TaxID=624186 RepID=UPI0001BB60E3|nr:bifunctional diaminohydroxyphosphoribosylaminopyrimidine deaminase/5-amino-6-(5-phosphoribosylamino)uracil reductase RibD [Blattabacterium sp. (Blattella germanica)]ACY40173.1 bifunctional diaminohydroxyphosphoribosylaminopyrimidine deaminase/5-amino-6-(5-phosphoribosylamino)uracil reductase [Blattabacterium sp. (Blattella germanica) str. Bge]